MVTAKRLFRVVPGFAAAWQRCVDGIRLPRHRRQDPHHSEAERGQQPGSDSAQPPPVTNDSTTDFTLLITLAIEGWRFSRVYSRMLSKLDAHDQPKYASQYRYFLRQIESTLASADLTLVSFDGQHFDPGLPVNPLNLADFSKSDTLVIDQTLEPVVMGASGLLRLGSVLLRKVAPDA